MPKKLIQPVVSWLVFGLTILAVVPELEKTLGSAVVVGFLGLFTISTILTILIAIKYKEED